VTICKDAGDWHLLNEQVLQLSKKHGQLKQAITKMVQVVMDFLDETPDLKTKMSAIETLRTVTEGKVCYERPRVKLSLNHILDIRRGRASEDHTDSVEYQEGGGRHTCC